ncbi:MAG: DUF4266 domain-containing protein [Gammaproteobacteria bacterium]|nr:DUF4266 domain-containing protein [Gammaproteobacteria bacterium]MDH5630825.1 DUF4266 domain-containing protein [Gammaproteobacteria bacterium]
MKQILRLLIVLSCIGLTACTTVQPWERGNLAKANMAWQPDPLDAQIRDHIYFAKEASSGGGKATGGGCGCN